MSRSAALLFLLFVLVGCEKKQTIPEILQSVGGDIGHYLTVPTEAGTVAVFTVKPEGEEFLAVGSVFAKETGNGKYVRDQGSSWIHYDNPNVIVSDDFYWPNAENAEPEDQGLHISYGFVPNINIESIYLLDRKENKWVKANYSKEKQIYYLLGEYSGTKAIGKNGAVIDIQGTGDMEMN